MSPHLASRPHRGSPAQPSSGRRRRRRHTANASTIGHSRSSQELFGLLLTSSRVRQMSLSSSSPSNPVEPMQLVSYHSDDETRTTTTTKTTRVPGRRLTLAHTVQLNSQHSPRRHISKRPLLSSHQSTLVNSSVVIRCLFSTKWLDVCARYTV